MLLKTNYVVVIVTKDKDVKIIINKACTIICECYCYTYFVFFFLIIWVNLTKEGSYAWGEKPNSSSTNYWLFSFSLFVFYLSNMDVT